MPTLDFKGKQFIYGHHLTVPIRTLEIDADKSLTGEEHPSLDDNWKHSSLDTQAESSVSILIPL